jgi:hypothetical protein
VTIRIQFTLFSAFYSPLISTMSGGFLDQEGLEYEWSVAAKREWLGTDMAKAFMRAYAKTRRYLNDTPAAEIARAAYEKTLDIFEYDGQLKRRFGYDGVCAPPPGG